MTRSIALLIVSSLLASSCAGDDRSVPTDASMRHDTGAVLPPPSGELGPLPPPPVGELGLPRFDGAPPTGSASCSEVQGCLVTKQCGAGNAACELACVGTGTAAAQSAFAAIRSCEGDAVKASCQACTSSAGSAPSESCLSCLEASCSAAYQGCGLTGSCATATKCTQTCTPGDAACGGACIGKLAPYQLHLFMTLDGCAKDAVAGACKSSCQNPAAQTCQMCVGPKCLTQAKACGLTP